MATNDMGIRCTPSDQQCESFDDDDFSGNLNWDTVDGEASTRSQTR
jgi:hypothetical protein